MGSIHIEMVPGIGEKMEHCRPGRFPQFEGPSEKNGLLSTIAFRILPDKCGRVLLCKSLQCKQKAARQ